MGEKVVHATAGRNLSVKFCVYGNMSRSHTTRTFIWNFLCNPRRNASLIPSSRFASRAIFEGIDLSQQAYVVELGPGTGCFTRELYANVPETCKVIVIELNPDFIPHLRSEYGDRFEIIKGSAADLDAYVEERGWPRIDLIVSGLPFTLPSPVSQPLMATLRKRTDAGAVYRWFTYFPWMMEWHYRRFAFRRVRSVFRNLPPMWIYTVN